MPIGIYLAVDFIEAEGDPVDAHFCALKVTCISKEVGERGLEPLLAVPKTAVLPIGRFPRGEIATNLSLFFYVDFKSYFCNATYFNCAV